ALARGPPGRPRGFAARRRSGASRRPDRSGPARPHALAAFLTLVSAAALAVILGALLAAESPATRVEPWKPAGVSSPQFESHAAVDPITGAFYFVRSSPGFEGWRIRVSRCGENGWSEPREPDFAGDGVEADPFFAADGRTLYFISTRSTDGVKRRDLDL